MAPTMLQELNYLIYNSTYKYQKLFMATFKPAIA
jgi:hypothetical protein